jgi:hypothetical protein
VKVYHGGGEMPSFEALNYDVYLGRRCSGPDADGRSYSSLVWLKANRPDGSHGPLKASADNCADHALASRR